MSTYKGSYKDHEIKIIVEEIQKYPNNLKHAFEEASYRLPNRTPAGISGFYYSNLKESMPNIIAMATPHGVMTNTKNSPRIRSGKVSMMLKFAEHMNREERETVALELFKNL